MTIAEMHVMFRQFAQQMGMQNVRAILPEQIDLLLNTSIGDTVNQLIRSTVGVTNDRIITDNSKILQINSLRPLYKVDEILVIGTNGFNFSRADRFNGRFNVNLDHTITYPTPGGPHPTETSRVFNEYLFIVDFAITYIPMTWTEDNTGWGVDNSTDVILDNEDFITNPYPIRLIDDAFLADTLNDFLLKPVLRSPVMTIVNNDLDIYFGEMINYEDRGYTLPHNLIPYKLRMSYIAKPCKVAYLADVTGDSEANVDCDLPENLHIDIVKHAVELYQQIAGRGGTQPQERENNNTGETTTPQQRQ